MDCPICMQHAVSFVDTKTNIGYYYCEACEFLCKDPACYQDLEVQKERYNLHQNDENDAGYQAYFERFLEFVLPLVGSPKTALDFGCGASSLLAALLQKQGIDCTYYDPLYHPDTQFKNRQYDLIVSTEVFEHLHEPKKVFEMLVARLEAGGYLAIQTQFHPNDKALFAQWYYHQDPTHIVFFTAKTFRVLCVQFGCTFVGDNGKNMLVIRKQ